MNRAGEEAAARGQDGVCLCGDSAGAYLCVYLAAMRENPAMAEAAGVSPVVPRIRALGLISGMFYTCRLDSIGMFLPDMLYGKGWRKRPFRPYTDPEYTARAGNLPPSFLVTARGDFLRHYSRRFYRAISRDSAAHCLLDIQGDRPLSHAFSAMLPETPEARDANGQRAAFLLRHC